MPGLWGGGDLPWALKRVIDDDGHVLERDAWTAVCAKTFQIMTSAPYSSDVVPVRPYVPVDPSNAATFHCRSTVRSPTETKGLLRVSDDKSKPSCC